MLTSERFELYWDQVVVGSEVMSSSQRFAFIFASTLGPHFSAKLWPFRQIALAFPISDPVEFRFS